MPSTIFSIAKYIQNPTKRHCETPENIYFNDELYTFQNYNIDGIVYNCEFGIDRHKKQRCRAKVLIPYKIHYSKDRKGEVRIIFSVHTNHPQEKIAQAPYFSENELAEIIETIYLSNKPRFGCYKILS